VRGRRVGPQKGSSGWARNRFRFISGSLARMPEPGRLALAAKICQALCTAGLHVLINFARHLAPPRANPAARAKVDTGLEVAESMDSVADRRAQGVVVASTLKNLVSAGEFRAGTGRVARIRL
jgi:hypothetical protein